MHRLLAAANPADLIAKLGVSPTLFFYMLFVGCVLVTLVWFCRIPVRYNMRNLTLRWPTTVMTALAFTAVIGLLTVMLAFVNGMRKLTAGSANPANLIILSQGSTDEGFSNLGFSEVGDIENQPGVQRQNDVPLCSRETYVVVNQIISEDAKGNSKRRFLQLRGVDDPATSAYVHDASLLEGGAWFSAAGVRDADEGQPSLIECVLGEGLAREMARDRTPEQTAQATNRERLDVGDQFRLADRTWVVAGIMKSSGSTFDSEVWAKRGLVGPKFGKETYTSLVLRAENAKGAAALKTLFQNYDKAKVNPLLESEYFAGLSGTSTQILWAVNFVAVVMGIGGVMGVMNTMFAATSQRIKDIGVLRLLGFSRFEIQVSFLLEAVVLGLVGGAAGCLLGMLCNGTTVNSIVASGGGGGGKFVVMKMLVDANNVAFGIALAVTMACVGGFIPAILAARKSALDALR